MEGSQRQNKEVRQGCQVNRISRSGGKRENKRFLLWLSETLGTYCSHQSHWQKALQRNHIPKIILILNTSEATSISKWELIFLKETKQLKAFLVLISSGQLISSPYSAWQGMCIMPVPRLLTARKKGGNIHLLIAAGSWSALTKVT